MRHSCVLLLLCLSWTWGQTLDEDEKKRLTDLFVTKPTPTEDNINLTPTKKPTNRGGELTEEERIRLEVLFGKTNTTDRAGNNTQCETKDGKSGVCVLYYQCNSEAGTAISDGSGILDIRSRECPHYLQVCCLLDDLGQKPRSPKKPPQQECGWTAADNVGFRINGEADSAEFGEFPWMVAILKRSDSATWSQSDYLGGGSIIHPSVVLTVAHKVDGKLPSELKCRAGEYDTQTELEATHQERNVKKIIQHEDFYRPSVLNSIALLILESPYDFTDAPHIGVACMAPQPPTPGTRCYSMGWGKEFADKEKYAVTLKKVELPIVARDKCRTELRKTRLGVHFELHPSITCAGGELGKDTCTGDGGSPLVCPIGKSNTGKEASRYEVVGMVAWGLGCGDAVPGAYVNTPQFNDWLGRRMNEEGFGNSSYTHT
ncbi:phenoloxidase-activating factor 2-like [Choristoneura fumiferana]|uniref:phenoloxidase-activating factor 2-like n=1 Tax=Choristoneura fumiferana TaxID=7141 RepID=UPI003D15DD8B